jgi:hypothetical protein
MWMSRKQDDDVIEFTPESGFTIESIAPMVVQVMREMEMDARLILPNDIVVEIDRDCTVKEIVAGYKEYMKSQIKSRPASNKNEKESHPKS